MTVRENAEAIVRVCAAKVIEQGDLHTIVSSGELAAAIPGIEPKDIRLAAQYLAEKGLAVYTEIGRKRDCAFHLRLTAAGLDFHEAIDRPRSATA